MTHKKFHCRAVPLLLALTGCTSGVRQTALPRDAEPTPPPFTVFDPAPGFQLPPLVLQYDPVAQTGADWASVGRPGRRASSPPAIIGAAATYLREGIARMTGHELAVVSTNDLSCGIVLTLLKHATPDIRDNAEICQGLAADPNDAYAAKLLLYAARPIVCCWSPIPPTGCSRR